MDSNADARVPPPTSISPSSAVALAAGASFPIPGSRFPPWHLAHRHAHLHCRALAGRSPVPVPPPPASTAPPASPVYADSPYEPGVYSDSPRSPTASPDREVHPKEAAPELLDQEPVILLDDEEPPPPPAIAFNPIADKPRHKYLCNSYGAQLSSFFERSERLRLDKWVAASGGTVPELQHPCSLPGHGHPANQCKVVWRFVHDILGLPLEFCSLAARFRIVGSRQLKSPDGAGSRFVVSVDGLGPVYPTIAATRSADEIYALALRLGNHLCPFHLGVETQPCYLYVKFKALYLASQDRGVSQQKLADLLRDFYEPVPNIVVKEANLIDVALPGSALASYPAFRPGKPAFLARVLAHPVFGAANPVDRAWPQALPTHPGDVNTYSVNFVPRFCECRHPSAHICGRRGQRGRYVF